MRMRGVIIGLVMGAAIAGLAAPQEGRAKAAFKRIGRIGLGVGYQPPGFSGQDLSGATHTLEESQGAVTVLHFWASWCPYCRGEVPELVPLSAMPGVKVLTVSVDEDLDALKRFIAEKQLSYPVIADKLMDPSLADQYGVSGIPVTFIVSPDGYILERFSGAADITAAVRTALDQ